MSWKDAIEDIVTEMQEEIEDLKGVEDAGSAYTRNCLKGYMKQLKSVVKAIGDISIAPANQAAQGNSFFNPTPISSGIHRTEIEKAKAEFRKKNVDKEEAMDGNMVELVDTPGEDGVSYHPIDPGMPVGARTLVAGFVYQLRRRNGKLVLVYDEVATETAKQQHVGKDPSGGIILGK